MGFNMPCHDSRDREPRIVYKEGVDPMYKKRVEVLETRCDALTDLLCKAGKSRHNKTDVPKEVLSWWESHCKWDRARGEPW
jgi:hypothetical protein